MVKTVAHLWWCTAGRECGHDDIIKWKYFPRYWPFVRGIHWSPVNSPHKGQWRGALVFSLICTWINGSVNNREAGDLRRYRAHCDVIVMENFTSKRKGHPLTDPIWVPHWNSVETRSKSCLAHVWETTSHAWQKMLTKIWRPAMRIGKRCR